MSENSLLAICSLFQKWKEMQSKFLLSDENKGCMLTYLLSKLMNSHREDLSTLS